MECEQQTHTIHSTLIDPPAHLDLIVTHRQVQQISYCTTDFS